MLSTDTIFLISVLLCFVMLLVLSALIRAPRAGIRDWLTANAAALIAFILYAFGKKISPLVGYEVANGMYGLAGATMLAGFYRFFGKRVPMAKLAAGIFLLVVSIACFHYWIDSFPLRTVAVSVYQASVTGLIAMQSFRYGRRRPYRYAYHFTAVMAALIAVGHALRGVVHLQNADHLTSLLQPAGINLFFLCAGAMMFPVLTLGAVMMVHDSMLEGAEMAANRDFLTGAWSRRAFFNLAERELAKQQRNRQPLSLLLLDVDHFKAINDTAGHASGDRVLVDLVKRAGPVIRSIDYLARIGGEEFAVLLPNTGMEEAYAVAERLRLTLGRFNVLPLDRPKVSGVNAYTVSIGLAVYRAEESLQDFMHRADEALYQAKGAGRNMVAGETGEMLASL